MTATRLVDEGHAEAMGRVDWPMNARVSLRTMHSNRAALAGSAHAPHLPAAVWLDDVHAGI
jgi:hypothetical protein